MPAKRSSYKKSKGKRTKGKRKIVKKRYTTRRSFDSKKHTRVDGRLVSKAKRAQGKQNPGQINLAIWRMMVQAEGYPKVKKDGRYMLAPKKGTSAYKKAKANYNKVKKEYSAEIEKAKKNFTKSKMDQVLRMIKKDYGY